MKEQCELYDRECINCGECEICDLDPSKKCDDCGRCIDEVDEYRSVTIDDFVKQHVSKEEIEEMNKKLSEVDTEYDEDTENNEYIEDGEGTEDKYSEDTEDDDYNEDS